MTNGSKIISVVEDNNELQYASIDNRYICTNTYFHNHVYCVRYYVCTSVYPTHITFNA